MVVAIQAHLRPTPASAADTPTKNVLILVKDLHVRITTSSGETLRDFQLDPTRDYQPQTKR